jgi:RES domain-containing protein
MRRRRAMSLRPRPLVPHVLTSLTILDPARVHVVQPPAVPNPNWLRPGSPSAGQQAFGDALLPAHAFVVIPSVVAVNSWTLMFIAATAAGAYAQRGREPFALDTRPNPPP